MFLKQHYIYESSAHLLCSDAKAHNAAQARRAESRERCRGSPVVVRVGVVVVNVDCFQKRDEDRRMEDQLFELRYDESFGHMLIADGHKKMGIELLLSSRHLLHQSFFSSSSRFTSLSSRTDRHSTSKFPECPSTTPNGTLLSSQTIRTSKSTQMSTNAPSFVPNKPRFTKNEPSASTK